MKTFNELEKAVRVRKCIYESVPNRSSLSRYAKAVIEKEAQREHINDVINQVSM